MVRASITASAVRPEFALGGLVERPLTASSPRMRHLLSLFLALATIIQGAAAFAPPLLPATGSPRTARGGLGLGTLRMQRPGGVEAGKRIRSYYDVLGLRDTKVGDDEVKKAYKAKARVCHPDVSQAPDAQEQFLLISSAYEVLSDPEKRQRYDQQLRAARMQITDARLVRDMNEPMSLASTIAVTIFGGIAAFPVIIPIALAKFCVEPFATTLTSISNGQCN